MNRITLQPSSSGLWHVEGIDCNRILRTSRNLERQGRWADACECRAEAVQQLLDVAGEESVPLDWNDSSSRAALEFVCVRGEKLRHVYSLMGIMGMI